MENYFIHESAIVEVGAHIGSGTKIWHFSHIMSGAKMGNHCTIGQNVFIALGVQIGNGVKIQNNVSVYEGVFIEDDVFVGPSVVFTNVVNPRSFVERKNEYRQTIIKKGASIGANATIVCGHTIGTYAMVGAGAVLTNDVSSYALVVGNPAKQIGWVSKQGYKLNFNKKRIAFCEQENETYILEKNTVIAKSDIAV